MYSQGKNVVEQYSNLGDGGITNVDVGTQRLSKTDR